MAEIAPYISRKILQNKVKEKGAISKDTAKTSKELGIDEESLEWLVCVKDVKKTHYAKDSSSEFIHLLLVIVD